MSCPRWSALCFCDQGIRVIRTQATRGGFRFGGHACLYAVLYIWLNTRHCRVSLPLWSSRHAPRPLGTRSPLRQTLTLSLYLSRERSNNLVTVTDRFTRPGPRRQTARQTDVLSHYSRWVISVILFLISKLELTTDYQENMTISVASVDFIPVESRDSRTKPSQRGKTTTIDHSNCSFLNNSVPLEMFEKTSAC